MAPPRREQADALVDLMVAVGGGLKSALPGVSLVVNAEALQGVPIVQGMEKSSQITDELVMRAQTVLALIQMVAFRELWRERGRPGWWSISRGTT